MLSKAVVLANECPKKYEILRKRFFDDWQPADATEEACLTKMINSYWRTCRLWAIETTLMDSAMFTLRGEFESGFSVYPAGMRAADALSAMNLHNRVNLETIQRHEAQMERIFERNLLQLRKLRAARGLTSEPVLPSLPPALANSAASLSGSPSSPSGAPLQLSALAVLQWLSEILIAVTVFLQALTTATSKLLGAAVPSPSHAAPNQRRNPAASRSARKPAVGKQQPAQPHQAEDAVAKPADPQVEASELHESEDPAATGRLPENLDSMDQDSFFATYSGTFSNPEKLNYQIVVTPGPGDSVRIPTTNEEQ
ncbi:MAG: hypothetical protein JNL98_37330 [Bryobacterales bacterium]|nr:hypothetical protein [Bryobacterales bacterium]